MRRILDHARNKKIFHDTLKRKVDTVCYINLRNYVKNEIKNTKYQHN